MLVAHNPNVSVSLSAAQSLRALEDEESSYSGTQSTEGCFLFFEWHRQ